MLTYLWSALCVISIGIPFFPRSQSILSLLPRPHARVERIYAVVDLRKGSSILATSTLLANSLLVSAAAGSQYNSNGISFQYPDNFVVSPKIVKTHGAEVYVKSETVSKFNAGITIDKVKLKNIKDLFSTPEKLAAKVTSVEKAKEGTFDVEVVGAIESAVPISQEGLPAYVIEYKVDSSRGQNHFKVKASVIDSMLCVFTVQSKEEDFARLEPEADRMLDSLVVFGSPLL